LPHSRLRFVNTERDGRAHRRAELLGIEPLLVHAVAGLVQDAEKRFVEMTDIIARGDTAIAGPHAAAKRMRGDIEPAGREIEADRRRRRLAKHRLAVYRLL